MKVLIKGAGEQASATGHRLFTCGYNVVMTEIAQPTAIRRTVSFCSAVYAKEIEIEGVRGTAHTFDQVLSMPPKRWDQVLVVVDPNAKLIDAWRPDVIVDARMLKRGPDTKITDASLVIGLGPGLVAGRDVHYVVETNRGHHLGRIIAAGSAQDDTGEPGNIGGYTRQRVLSAPTAGVLTATKNIGNSVHAGDIVANVDDQAICANIGGVLRGLLYPGLAVVAGQKVGDVDPRGDRSYCFTFSDKARTISGSVLEIVIGYANKQQP